MWSHRALDLKRRRKNQLRYLKTHWNLRKKHKFYKLRAKPIVAVKFPIRIEHLINLRCRTPAFTYRTWTRFYKKWRSKSKKFTKWCIKQSSSSSLDLSKFGLEPREICHFDCHNFSSPRKLLFMILETKSFEPACKKTWYE